MQLARWLIACVMAVHGVNVIVPPTPRKEYFTADAQLAKLAESNFSTFISTGNWWIFYGSKWCSHCQDLTPIWLEMATWAQDAVPNVKEALIVKVAKVECTVSESLCASLVGFPTLTFYTNGQKETLPESSARILKDLKKDLLAFSARAPKPTPLDTELWALSKLKDGDGSFWGNGTLVHLTDADFTAGLQGPWLLMLHAKWCSHCQQFGPVYAQLALKLKGKVNVGKVDCTINPKVCAAFEVKGYPTLGLLDTSNNFKEFKGTRSGESLETFALDQLVYGRVKVVGIRPAEVDAIIAREEVAFFLTYDANATTGVYEDLIPITRQQKVTLYVCPALVPQFSVPSPSLLVYRDGFQTAFSGSLESNSLVNQFISAHKTPLLPQLSEENFKRVYGEWLLALVILDPDTKSQLTEARKVAKSGVAGLMFAWIDTFKYNSYLTRVFGHNGVTPAIIVLDATKEVYWDKTAKGETIVFGNLGEVVKEVQDGTLPPKSTRGWIGNMWESLKYSLTTSPLLWIISVVVVGLLVAYCSRVVPHDYRFLEEKKE